MRYFALVVDFDATLASEGRVCERTVDALDRVRQSGRRVILVTGRTLDDILTACPCLHLIDGIVAENGALYHVPATHETVPLAEPVPEPFVEALRRHGVDPLSVGRSITSTTVTNKTRMLDAVQEVGREQHIVFNRGIVMALPAGVSKASGMAFALRKLELSPHEAVGIGDAENDYSFLRMCECSAAVANAIDSIKELASFTTRGAAGDGVVEVIDELVANDLQEITAKHDLGTLCLGLVRDGGPVLMPAYGRNVLIAGPSGSGKSTLATGLIERLSQQRYQVCVIDPEGDYRTLQDVVALGNEQRSPNPDEILAVLDDPKVNVAVNLLGVPLADRPYFFAQLLPRLQAMRARTSRPHWLLIDEAHHLLPIASAVASLTLPQKLGETILITVHPDQVAASILSFVDVVIAVGPMPRQTLTNFANAVGRAAPPAYEEASPGSGEVVAWFVRNEPPPFPMQVIPARADRIRHHRKYAQGDLSYNSFFFRGPAQRLNLRAQNLMLFVQMAEGIDTESWLFHLRNGDYARWFRDVIKDAKLASIAKELRQRNDMSADESRRILCNAIRKRYTLPER